MGYAYYQLFWPGYGCCGLCCVQNCDRFICDSMTCVRNWKRKIRTCNLSWGDPVWLTGRQHPNLTVNCSTSLSYSEHVTWRQMHNLFIHSPFTTAFWWHSRLCWRPRYLRTAQGPQTSWSPLPGNLFRPETEKSHFYTSELLASLTLTETHQLHNYRWKIQISKKLKTDPSAQTTTGLVEFMVWASTKNSNYRMHYISLQNTKQCSDVNTTLN